MLDFYTKKYCWIKQSEHKASLNSHKHAHTHTQNLFRCPKETSSSPTFRIIFVRPFHTLSSVLLMYCNTYLAHLHLYPSFFSPPLPFCSSDCDELSHLKCFLSRCIPGGFQSLSIFPRPRAPTHPCLCWIPSLAVHSSPHPLPYCRCSLYLSLPVSCLFSLPLLISATVSSL